VELGSNALAGRIAPDLNDRVAEDLLWGKRTDPVSAVIAGYHMVRTGRVDRPEWLENLVAWFPSFADTAVIRGASALLDEDSTVCRAKAREYLIEATRRGIPAYTVGLRLLFDGLRRLVEKDFNDDPLQEALAAVRAVAAYADWGSTQTTFTSQPPFVRP
jgi:hypothetical protein